MISTNQKVCIPFTFVVDQEFEHAMSIWSPKLNRVLPWNAVGRGREKSANMWVKHREVELEVSKTGVRLPSRGFRVPARNVCIENLRELLILGKDTEEWTVHTIWSLIV